MRAHKDLVSMSDFIASLVKHFTVHFKPSSNVAKVFDLFCNASGGGCFILWPYDSNMVCIVNNGALL